MENEIAKMLVEEIREERELRKKLAARLEALDALTRITHVTHTPGKDDSGVSDKRIIVTEKPNSYEFGKAGKKFKVYFDSIEDGKKALETCKSLAEHRTKLFGDD